MKQAAEKIVNGPTQADSTLDSLPPNLQALLQNPLRRRLLRALHTQRLPSTVRELLSREGLTREANSRISYHAAQLVDAGALSVVEELAVYRSRVVDDPNVIAYLEATAQEDASLANEV